MTTNEDVRFLSRRMDRATSCAFISDFWPASSPSLQEVIIACARLNRVNLHFGFVELFQQE
jgi:hypothetical protein